VLLSDVDALVSEASRHTRDKLLLTYPQDRVGIRLGVHVVNLWLRLSRCGFRTYAHRVEQILAVAGEHGLTVDARRRSGVVWESVALSRSNE
jgi:hypothetical protein